MSLPKISSSSKIGIICEGYEEYEYIKKLIALEVWSSEYNFKLINAEGNGNIPARYQDLYASDSYDLVLIFCDTDQKPFEDYDMIKMKINTIHGLDNSSQHVIIFANPCTMQIVLLHFGHVLLESHRKQENRKHIKDLTEVKGYEAKRTQREQLFSQITLRNYYEMKTNVSSLASDDVIMPSTNFLKFTDWFEKRDKSWIEHINDIFNN